MAVATLAAVATGVGAALWLAVRADGRMRALGRRVRNAFYEPVAVSVMPGPPRVEDPARLRFDEHNSHVMRVPGHQDQERWRDVAGNLYSVAFAASFRYQAEDGRDFPVVRARWDEEGATFCGRVEATGLKPNFAYQLKLNGVFEDRRAFEAIGYAGRWRLPGLDTNYTDDDYRAYPEPSLVEAYILFDYFVTDAQGRAVRDFCLDSSLHVLWTLDQIRPARTQHVWTVVVRADDPAVYAFPTALPQTIGLWAEREMARYKSAGQKTALPPGRYRAELALTEESFHDEREAGGHWATVLTLPVEFTIAH